MVPVARTSYKIRPRVTFAIRQFGLLPALKLVHDRPARGKRQPADNCHNEESFQKSFHCKAVGVKGDVKSKVICGKTPFYQTRRACGEF